jgi:NAD(P)-dependent dehydrogenase (short-subunit alcohol dehydrogenase family)
VPTVLLTGASTGIGRAAAERLAGSGWRVLAGARGDADLQALATIRNVEPIKLDVTSDEDVANAAATVGERLDALVNNAGIATTGPLEALPLEAWRDQIEVNLLGAVRVTRAVVPAIIAAGGRIVNMSSIGGRSALPLFGPYSASKFALEGMNDSLRRELRDHGVQVIAIEPGAIATPIWGKGLEAADRQLAQAGEAARRRYEGLIAVIRRQAEHAAKHGLDPSEVAEVVQTALTVPRPRTRYVVGRQARVQAVMARVLPDRAIDALVGRVLR